MICLLFSPVYLQLFHLGEEEEKNWGPGLTVSFTGQGEEIGQHLDKRIVDFPVLVLVKPQNKGAAISAPPLPSSHIFQGQSITLRNGKFRSAQQPQQPGEKSPEHHPETTGQTLSLLLE